MCSYLPLGMLGFFAFLAQLKGFSVLLGSKIAEVLNLLLRSARESLQQIGTHSVQLILHSVFCIVLCEFN